MRVYRGIPARAEHASVLTIGNFDGVHRGHRALLKLLTDRARQLGLPAVVLTFEPHPREYFSPADAPARLASAREKLMLLAAAGVDEVCVCRFDARFAALSAQGFIDDVVIRGLAARHVYIGDDFCFGARRQGNFDMLADAGAQHGFSVESMPTLEVEGERVSSSAVRAALAEGDMAHAARLLGRPYSIAGRVIHGDKIGRKLGYPTANVQMKHRKPALAGIYTVSVEGLGERPVAGVASIGVRPTVTNAGRPTLEVNLFDWNQDCYGAHLRVNFLRKQRDEARFDSLDALTAQITRDADEARAWFATHPDHRPGD